MKQAIVTSNLAADAYGIVRKRLVRGEVRLGQPISRRRLAAELGMSLLPVTIALLRLEYEGFLESRPRAGTRVRIPSPDDLHGHYVVRDALETHAARIFAAQASQKERDELRQLGAQVDALSAGSDRIRYVTAHHLFHRRIADAAHCMMLSATVEHRHALAAVWFCAMNDLPLHQPPRRHQALAETLAEAGPDGAAAAVSAHIASGLQHVLGALKPYFALRRKSSRTFARTAAGPH
jgi:DNA-binding GntR family transcriptional regulator